MVHSVSAHSLNAPFLYVKKWPEDGLLEPKHVANYILMIICVCVCVYIYIYICCLTEKNVTLSVM